MTALKIIKKSFTDFYTHLFPMVMVSLIWFFPVAYLLYLAIGGIFSNQLFFALLALIFVGPLTLAAFDVTNKAVKTGETGILDYFKAIKKHFVKGMLASWLHVGVLLVFVLDFFFFARFGNKILMYLSGIWLYLTVFFLMSQIYFWSLLVETDSKMMKCLKHSLIMTLDNLFYSTAIFLALVVLVAISIATAGVALAVTFAGFLGILAHNASFNLLVKYDLRKEIISPYDAQ